MNNSKDENIVSAYPEKIMDSTMIGVEINDNLYIANLEQTSAVSEFLSLTPVELNMSDLNHNEKYAYLSLSIGGDSNYTGHISKGDIMLYNNNCIVIFYKDFETTYNYIKIGHIDNLPDLGNGDITVSFVR